MVREWPGEIANAMTVVLRKELLSDPFDFVHVEVRKSETAAAARAGALVLGFDCEVGLVPVVLEFAHVDG